MLHCDLCGGPLEVFEGEPYCPDCTHYAALAGLHHATDEALALDPARGPGRRKGAPWRNLSGRDGCRN